MNNSNNPYTPPDSELESGQGDAQKKEKKILKDVSRLLEDEEKYVMQRTIMLCAFMAFSLLGVTYLVFVYFQEVEIKASHLVLSALSGLLFGLGLWLVSFLNSWPVLKKYFRKEAILKRNKEINS